jgi:hypothetical protein
VADEKAILFFEADRHGRGNGMVMLGCFVRSSGAATMCGAIMMKLGNLDVWLLDKD